MAEKEPVARKEIPIHDVHFAAFTLYHKFTPRLKLVNNRVAFVYLANETFYKLMEDYYQTQKDFNLPDYIDALKRAKSLMYAVKEGGSHD